MKKVHNSTELWMWSVEWKMVQCNGSDVVNRGGVVCFIPNQNLPNKIIPQLALLHIRPK